MSWQGCLYFSACFVFQGQGALGYLLSLWGICQQNLSVVENLSADAIAWVESAVVGPF
jgi:hypothetical protein